MTTDSPAAAPPSVSPPPEPVVIDPAARGRFEEGELLDLAATARRLSEECGWQPSLVLVTEPDAETLGG